jgi:protein gp37
VLLPGRGAQPNLARTFCLSLPVRSLIGGAHDGLEYRRALVAELLPKRKGTILTGVPVKLGFTFASECDSKQVDDAMADSKIEWTNATWNPVAGCSIISPGCTNCYAMRMAARLAAMGQEKYGGLTRRSGNRSVWTGRIRLDERALDLPRQWTKSKLVFVNSMSDLFHDDVPIEFVVRVWEVMRNTQRHTYQILSKRPDRMFAVTRGLPLLPNVWLGTSVENSDYLYRINQLRLVPAMVRFVSFEPLLDSVGDVNLCEINWAIVGGESGPRARPMKEKWVEEIESACRRSGTAFFFKQWGGKNKKRSGRLLRGATFNEMPQAQNASLHI